MFDKKKYFEKLFYSYKNTNKIPSVDLHIHTSWTDGENTVNEMYNEAIKKKIETLLFSEHSRQDSGDWFLDFAKEIKFLRKQDKKKCLLLIGTEVKIVNYKGDIDLSSKIKNQCDLIMASVHRFPNEGTIKNAQGQYLNNKIEKFPTEDAHIIEFDLTIGAMENSNVDIIGHPFGMTIKRFGQNPPWDYFLKLIKKAKKNDKIIEVNYYYHKNHRKILDACIDNGTLISFGSNAHSISELGRISAV